jgi:hypothetical protein
MTDRRHDLPTLAALVGDTDRFAGEHWGRVPLVRRHVDLPPLLSVDQLDTWIGSGARRPSFRLVQEGITFDSGAGTRRARVGGRDVDDLAHPAAIAALLARGATLVAQNLELGVPAVATFVQALSDDLSHPVQANAYLSPPAAHGLGRHRDNHDVFVLQLEGTKRWDVEGTGEIELRPGDVLYLPTSIAHDAHTTDRTSLHLTIGVLRVTIRQALRRLVDRLDGADEALPVGFARSGELEPWLSKRLGAIAETLTVFELADAEVARARARRSADGRGAVASMARRLHIGPASRIQFADAARIVDGGHVAEVHVGGRVVEVPAAGRPALDLLAAGSVVAVGDLPGLDPQSRVVLARRLVREGVVELRA